MGMKLRLLSIIVFSLALTSYSNAGKPPVVKWSVKNPFEQKVFIENKGQYEILDKVESKDILFGARQDGLQYYFTNNSIWIKRSVPVMMTEAEMEKLEHDKGEKNDKEIKYKLVDEFHSITFIGADASTQISSDDKVS